MFHRVQGLFICADKILNGFLHQREVFILASDIDVFQRDDRRFFLRVIDRVAHLADMIVRFHQPEKQVSLAVKHRVGPHKVIMILEQLHDPEYRVSMGSLPV